MNEDVHFDDGTGRPLCGAPGVFVAGLMRSNPKADCEACCDVHARLTGWSFPLPELIIVEDR